MEKEKLESLLIDMIDGKLTPEAKKEVESILAADPEARLMLEQFREVTKAIDNSSEL